MVGLSIRRCVVAAAAMLLTTALLPEPAAAQNLPGGSWRQSCRNAQMFQGNVLQAECQTRNGQWKRSSIDADRCGRGGTVANINGDLTCENVQGNNQNLPGGSWRQSCRNAQMFQGNVLQADCQTRNGQWKRSSIDADRCGRGGTVANINGDLTCEGQGAHGGGGSQPRGSWQQSCRNGRVQGQILSAECRSSGGRWTSSQINFDRCPGNAVRNDDGFLKCENQQGGGGGYSPWWGQGLPQGSYQRSCRNARLEGRDLLTAECQRNSGSFRYTRLDIDECRGRDIANDNGHLICGGKTYSGDYGKYRMPPGAWAQNCRNARIIRDDLYAECRTSDGDWVNTSIDLDDCGSRSITTQNGRLRCN